MDFSDNFTFQSSLGCPGCLTLLQCSSTSQVRRTNAIVSWILLNLAPFALLGPCLGESDDYILPKSSAHLPFLRLTLLVNQIYQTLLRSYESRMRSITSRHTVDALFVEVIYHENINEIRIIPYLSETSSMHEFKIDLVISLRQKCPNSLCIVCK